MDKSLFLSMSGASQNMLAQRAHANNLANVSTTGFRRDFEQARSMPVFGEGLPTRAYAMTERPGTDMSAGVLQETGRDLDVAVEGEGWIAVQAPDGGEAYTRAGNLKIDVFGILRTSGGLPVLGNAGPIALPPADKVEIGTDGTISFRAQGEAPNVLAEVDRIKLVKPDQVAMHKGEDGLMRMNDGQEQPADGAVTLVTGFLEGSNVNAVEEMTAMLSLARQFELHIKMMRTAEENAQATNKLLQIS
ncbi:flagellar basal-body rod protein FlgF [Pseudomonas sp. G11-1]|uniref:Flagellar basal-body rod protein FlgF n=1 Tax=Halopseudomonas bauzanensis TaxID=653930 RepID=A0A4U0YQE0_9GAMM|nr:MULTISPECIES: flagellar basal-body rod protein FlgF [Halopseudomonas]MCO5786354.1 flagellar basal-body rod protein FlgF [Pseudomonas sp. G11-1]MCO5789580.1 flagellar basal-body rod protein FlgF [Pseudomonas sp. G11-2]EZQ18460.1 flagellar basal body rod protein FlgF [Halopseudomonas bauzanensis]TKA92466.1 flagellar basal-body rod protein FlgF [Halopseudomonas bauzanensis]WGK62725.1 flagellar basal-body rod protein FlgF [Halopseudomonas sp. SMJS2]